MLEIISKRSQLHSIIVKVFQSLGVLSRYFPPYCDRLACFSIGILYRRLWNRGSRKEESTEKIIAGEAAMSYRLRLLLAVSHSGHNFTGDSWSTVSPWITEREREKQEENSLSFLFLSLAGRVIYRTGNHPCF